MGKPEKVLREAGMLCNPRTPASVLRSQRNASLPAVDLSAPGGAEAAYDKMSKLVRVLRTEHAAVKVLTPTQP